MIRQIAFDVYILVMATLVIGGYLWFLWASAHSKPPKQQQPRYPRRSRKRDGQ